jgi:diguanylate cyclase (GGDEF)-like protein/PAS domain S-box-containing protein
MSRWSTLESIPDAIVVVDHDGRMSYVNDQAITLFGYRRDELLGQPVEILLPEGRRDAHREHRALYAADPSNRIMGHERIFPARRKDGTVIYVEIGLSPMSHAGDRRTLASVRDVSERRARERDRRLQSAALEAAANGILITDGTGRITWVNAAFTRLTGYSTEEVVGKTPRLLKSDVHDAAFYEELWATISAGRVWHGEMVNRHKDGHLFTEEQTITPVPDPSEPSSFHYIAIKQDITRRKEERAQLSQRVRELGVLYDLAKASMEATSVDALFEDATRIIGGALYGDNFGVGLLSDHEDVVRLHRSYAGTELGGSALPLEDSIVAEVVETRAAVRIAENRESGRTSFAPGIRSVLCVPLIAHGRVVAVLNVESNDENAFDESDEKLLTTVAGQLAAGVTRIELFGEVERLAITDPLMGIFNRRHFFARAEEELQRAVRHERPLTVLMLDLDHFKRINDRHGHQVGDEILAAAARACAGELRNGDLLARYGGEELVVLLPDAPIDQAVVVAGRLRAVVGKTEVATADGPVSVTLSIGAAALDGTCRDLLALVNRADRALYAAKAAGRDRVVVWTDETPETPREPRSD